MKYTSPTFSSFSAPVSYDTVNVTLKIHLSRALTEGSKKIVFPSINKLNWK